MYAHHLIATIHPSGFVKVSRAGRSLAKPHKFEDFETNPLVFCTRPFHAFSALFFFVKEPTVF
jgi:hypothetical protein